MTSLIEDLLRKQRDQKELVRIAEKAASSGRFELNQIEYAIRTQLAAQLGVNVSDVWTSDWICPTSPIGECVYDLRSDPHEEDCLFCHEPEERK